uniref:Zgc:162396 n=1 Tax=Gouania willdenowi TaxID=441366 RepID=A0A8C5HGC1_GOUWI
MAFPLFEGKQHASIYQKYRFTPPNELKDIIIQYLDKKKGPPHVLALDLGCGTGQNSRLLSSHFQEVVGMDISECQLEEARSVAGYPNVTYRKGSAEELQFPDGSVDLLTAASAAHWFDQSRFLAEASRILKTGGCLALLGFTDHNTRFYYQDREERLSLIYKEVKQELLPYTSHQVAVANSKLENLYSAIPFPDKERYAQHKPPSSPQRSQHRIIKLKAIILSRAGSGYNGAPSESRHVKDGLKCILIFYLLLFLFHFEDSIFAPLQQMPSKATAWFADAQNRP